MDTSISAWFIRNIRLCDTTPFRTRDWRKNSMTYAVFSANQYSLH